MRKLLILLFTLATAACFAQYDPPGYYLLSISSTGVCNCPPKAAGSISGATYGPTGWLTVAGPCSNDGVSVPWNHYGSHLYTWSYSPPAGTCVAWVIVYATSSPNVQVPKCTNGQIPETTNPYGGVFIETPPTTPCPKAVPVDPIGPVGPLLASERR